MKILFACPECEQPATRSLPAADWQCPHCDHLLRLPPQGEIESLAACPICGNREIYKKKDFPHWLGLTILTVACLAFLLANAFRHQWLAWVILIGSALIDGLMYLFVGDVSVCYRCGAHCRGFAASAAHPPHDLGISERYRQERLRREQLEQESRAHKPQE